MAKQIRIPVPEGIIGHGRTHTEVVLREPTFREYMDIGDVVEHVSYPNGMRLATINNATVDSYFKACLVDPKDPLVVEQGGLALAREVREAIVGFIHGESRVAAPSETSPKTSSGDAAKDASQQAT